MVVVCASLGGGTGAGIALDVVDLVRRTHELGADPILVLFSVDIFDDPDQHMAGNSLGFMCELLSSYWSNVTEPGAGDVFEGNVPSPGHGPGAVFLVGSQSMRGNRIGAGDSHSSGSVAVYRAVGEALSSWVVDDAVQQQVIEYTKTNWQSKATQTQGGYPFGAATDQPGVVSSFGAATLGVGRERFGRWARDLLVRETVDALVRGHLSPNHFPADSKLTEYQRTEALATRCLSRLFAAGSDDDPGTGLSTAYHRFLEETDDTSWIGDEFRGRFQADEVMAGYDWKSQVEEDVNRELADDVRPDGDELDEDTLADWGGRFVDDMCAAVSRVIAEHSVPVVVKALELAGIEATKYSEDQVRQAEENRDEYRTAFNSAASQLQKRRKLKRDSDAVEAAIESGVELLDAEWELARHGVVRRVVLSAVQGVYGQLIDALGRRNRDLETTLGVEPVMGYPLSGQAPPAAYRPAPSEFVLEGPASWPELLDGLCRQTRRGDRRVSSMDAARSVLVGGDGPLGLSPVLRISDADRKWVPLDGRRFEFTCDLDVDSVERRVTDLMASATFSAVLREGLGQYLSSAHGDHASRMAAYSDCLHDALTMASPLVQLDSGLCSLLYDSDDVGPGAVELVCSEFPFGPGDPAYEAAKSRLDNAYRQAAGGEDPSSVLLSSFMRCPVHPMAISSLTSEIAGAVQSCKSAERLQTSFWRWRRSRTLPSFVPVSKDMRRAMIRGFAIGLMCGYINVTKDKESGKITKEVTITSTPVEVGAETVAFPWPLLSHVEKSQELLPALLESFSLCFASVGSEQFGAFEPYSRLHNLGQDLRAGSGSSLRQLIATGQVPRPTVGKPRVQGPTDTERRASAQQYLKTQIEFFETLEATMFRGDECCDETGRSPTKDDKPTTSYLNLREIAHEIRVCYRDVLDSLNQKLEAPEI